MTTTADGVSSKLVQPAIYRGAVTPTSADIGDLWEDTSTSPPTLKQCTAAPNTFAAVSSSVAITGGTIDGATIGATTPSTGTFTTLTAQTEVLKGTGSNLLGNSQGFSNATYWSVSNASVTANSTTAPDGTTTASTLVNNAANSTHYLLGTATGYAVLVTGATYTVSVYAKPAGLNRIQFQGDGSSGFLGNATVFNVSTGTVVSTGSGVTSASITSAANGFYRCSITAVATGTVGRPLVFLDNGTTNSYTGDGTSGVYLWGMQVEFGSTVGTYVPTTTTAIYGTPSLSFSGVAGLGLQSDGSLYVSPAGTGAIQAQKTDSSATGGNARGANAVDWQTSRNAANQVASGQFSLIAGGTANRSASYGSSIVGGGSNATSTGSYQSILGGTSNSATGDWSVVVAGQSNTAGGVYNFVGGGFTNSGTSVSAVTTQSGTMNGTTAVTLSGSNASIKVGQAVTGTSIAVYTYVAAISGTSLTLSQAASGSSTSTLSFYTPHGVVVGGGNNQATGSYSFIGGGGDAGTAGNRNVASGDWSTVGGGVKNTASGAGSVVCGGGYDGTSINGNTASGSASFVGGGQSNTASGTGSSVLGGLGSTANAVYSTVLGGRSGTTRSIVGLQTFSACNIPISSGQGISQSALLVLGVQTTDATATVLTSNTSAASGTNQVILPNNSAYYFRGEVVAGVTGAGDTKGWSIEGVIKRGAGVATAALVGTPTVTSLYADTGAATWTVTALADTTNGGLKITVTGQASTTIRWVAQIRTTEMTY